MYQLTLLCFTLPVQNTSYTGDR